MGLWPRLVRDLRGESRGAVRKDARDKARAVGQVADLVRKLDIRPNDPVVRNARENRDSEAVGERRLRPTLPSGRRRLISRFQLPGDHRHELHEAPTRVVRDDRANRMPDRLDTAPANVRR